MRASAENCLQTCRPLRQVQCAAGGGGEGRRRRAGDVQAPAQRVAGRGRPVPRRHGRRLSAHSRQVALLSAASLKVPIMLASTSTDTLYGNSGRAAWFCVHDLNVSYELAHNAITKFPTPCRSLRRGAEAVPKEAAAAVAARQAAVDLCQRCAGDTASDLKAEDLWFPLLQVPGACTRPALTAVACTECHCNSKDMSTVPCTFPAYISMHVDQAPPVILLCCPQCYIRQLQELRHIERELPPPPPTPTSPPAAGSGGRASSLLRLRSIEQPASPLALVRTGAGCSLEGTCKLRSVTAESAPPLI